MRSARTILTAVLALPVLMLLRTPAEAAVSNCEPDGIQASGAFYRICMPETWNGDLVVFAHGYQGFNEPVHIPEDQLSLPDGTSVPQIVNQLGYAFATTSYSTTGLAVLQGIDDVVDLVGVFNNTHAHARRVFLVGPSEGGIVTALTIERHPDVFAGGLAACGPIGNFAKQINYDGDFRVVFDYFFPGVIPGDPINVPAETIDHFFDEVVPAIHAAIEANPDGVRQLLNTVHAPIDPNDPTTVETTIDTLAWYTVFTSNDAHDKLGGQPFDNRFRHYIGSDDDPLLNQEVQRAGADPAALTEIMNDYQTTGRLRVPLVTLHTSGDEVIPYWHENMYMLKTILSGSFLKRHINIRVPRYGHCNFKAPEVLTGFAILIFMANHQSVAGFEAALPDEASRAEFRTLLRDNIPVP